MSIKVSRDKLKAFIDRIENMDEQIALLKMDRKEIFDEAKGEGYDTKILRKVIRIRKMSRDARAEEEALLDTYLSALGEA